MFIELTKRYSVFPALRIGNLCLLWLSHWHFGFGRSRTSLPCSHPIDWYFNLGKLLIQSEEAVVKRSDPQSAFPLPSRFLKPLSGHEAIDHPRWTIRGYRAMHEIGYGQHPRNQNLPTHSESPHALYRIRRTLLEDVARLETEYKDGKPFQLAVRCPYCPPYCFPLETEF
jgi:hypothetical protein